MLVLWCGRAPGQHAERAAPGETIVYGLDEHYPPYEYVDRAGHPAGFLVELMREIGRELGQPVEYHAAAWSVLRQMQQDDRVQVISLVRTPERQREMAFTVAHTLLTYTAFVRRAEVAQYRAQGLGGLRVVTQQADTSYETLLARGLPVVGLPDPATALDAVAHGTADVAVVSKYVGLYHLRRSRSEAVRSVGEPLIVGQYAFGAYARHADLITRLDYGLSVLKQTGAYDRIRDAWLGVLEPPVDVGERVRHVLLIAAGPVAFLVLAALLWVWLLRLTIDRRTKELGRSRGLLQAVLDNTYDGVMVHDDQGRLSDVNARVLSMFGIEREQALGKTVLDLSGPGASAAQAVEYCRRAMLGHNQLFEWQCQRQDTGEVFDVEVFLTRIEQAGGPTILANVRDITERRRDEERLRLAEFSIAQSGLPIFWFDEAGHILQVNAAACESLGYTADELCHLTVYDIDPDYDAARYAATWGKVAAERHHLFETCHRRRDGSVFPVEVSSSYLEYGGRGFKLSFARDITDRRVAEAALRRLAMAIDQAADCVLIVHHEGRIEYVNPSFEQTTGYAADELLGTLAGRLNLVTSHDVAEHDIVSWLGRGQPWAGRLEMRRRDGRCFEANVTASPVRDEAGRLAHMVVVFRDITREVDLEAKLHQAQKMEAIGLLAGGVAHDLNNMLAPILGYAEMLLDSGLSEQHQGDLAQIVKAAERARDLVRQLMAFGRKQPLQVALLDLNEVVHNWQALLSRTLRDDIALVLHLAATPCRLRADRTQVEQVLMNLAVNAQDAMPDGGELRIETSHVVLDERQAAQYVDVAPGEYVLLAVHDSGHGMAPETAARILEPFFTTKARGKGTGLGLATVFGIAKQHGGHVQVESSLGAGSTFRVYFPAVTEDAAEPSGLPETADVVGGQETILVAEDDRTVREMACSMLRRLGYQVLTASSATECLELGRQQADRVDLLLTDVIMPDLSGRDLHVQLAECIPGLRVVYMSGYTADVIADRYLAEPGVEIITKPFTRHALAEKIRQALEA